MPQNHIIRVQKNPAMFVTVLSCFEPMTVSWETYIKPWLTCPRKGTSKVVLRTPTCESGFEALNRTAFAGFFDNISSEIHKEAAANSTASFFHLNIRIVC